MYSKYMYKHYQYLILIIIISLYVGISQVGICRQVCQRTSVTYIA